MELFMLWPEGEKVREIDFHSQLIYRGEFPRSNSQFVLQIRVALRTQVDKLIVALPIRTKAQLLTFD